MKPWAYQYWKNEYKQCIDEFYQSSKLHGVNLRSSFAFTSNEYSIGLEGGRTDHDQFLDNIHHFTILGALCIEYGILRTREELDFDDYSYDVDSFLFEEYVVLHFDENSLKETAELVEPNERQLFLAEAKKVMDAIG